MKLVAEREFGVTTETELACIERDEQISLAELGLRLDEAKQVTAALQAEVVPAQMAALSACSQACAGCGRRLAPEFAATRHARRGVIPIGSSADSDVMLDAADL